MCFISCIAGEQSRVELQKMAGIFAFGNLTFLYWCQVRVMAAARAIAARRGDFGASVFSYSCGGHLIRAASHAGVAGVVRARRGLPEEMEKRGSLDICFASNPLANYQFVDQCVDSCHITLFRKEQTLPGAREVAIVGLRYLDNRGARRSLRHTQNPVSN